MKLKLAGLFTILTLSAVLISYFLFPCPPGQRVRKVFTGGGYIRQCFTPAADADKPCLQATDCTNRVCIVDQNSPLLKSCLNPESTVVFCENISGFCGDGSETTGIFINQRDYIEQSSAIY